VPSSASDLSSPALPPSAAAAERNSEVRFVAFRPVSTVTPGSNVTDSVSMPPRFLTETVTDSSSVVIRDSLYR